MTNSARSYFVTSVAVVIGAFIFLSPKEESSVNATATTSRQIPIPDEQARFIAAIDSGRAAYKAGANEMAKGAARPQRAQLLCNGSSQLQRVQNWIGKVATLSSNGDGKGVLSIMIGNNVHVKTWNNFLSDTGAGTLIEPSSPLFRRASSLSVGQVVAFSGSFIPDRTDCVRESSMTLDGSIREPEFIFRFSDVTAVNK
ncbi:hypothetical protein [Bradyrhizobium stylosanthis]|uniref:hypothetical protein n=1 Tax=Bradyrhizobium stylosanthis TaxID=1803665 RepID=UPI0012E81C20|nr:hypothetical protein [Bradyrhizobium stylosanthis]